MIESYSRTFPNATGENRGVDDSVDCGIGNSHFVQQPTIRKVSVAHRFALINRMCLSFVTDNFSNFSRLKAFSNC